MTGDQQDKWSVLVAAVSQISNDRCTSPVTTIGDALDTLVKELLAVAYDRDTTDAEVQRVAKIVGLAYSLGRSNEYLYNKLLKGV